MRGAKWFPAPTGLVEREQESDTCVTIKTQALEHDQQAD